MKRYTLLFSTTALGLAMFALPLRAQQAQDPSATTGIQGQSSSADKTDARFIKEAARGNDLEIAMGQLGATKAQDSQLKSFCEKIGRASCRERV